MRYRNFDLKFDQGLEFGKPVEVEFVFTFPRVLLGSGRSRVLSLCITRPRAFFLPRRFFGYFEFPQVNNFR